MKYHQRFAVLKTSRTKSALVAAASFAFTVSACSRDKTAQSTDSTASSTAVTASSSPVSAPIPAGITDVGTYGEDLYDQAKAGDWAKAKAYLDSLRAASANLPAGDQIQPERDSLGIAITALDKAIAARNRTAALEAANRATYLSAQMTDPYDGATPMEVVLLDYYGRELEIWSAQRNLPKLRETAAALESTWNAVRPAVVRNGGTVAAAQTDSLVASIKAAKTPADYARVATPFLNQVDVLEVVFVKP
jgi:hypothetical protein